MSRVLVVGHSPLPWEDLSRSYGPGTRTWQFAAPLIARGHEVVILASRIPFVYPEDLEPVEVEDRNGCRIYRVTQEKFEVGGFTDNLIEDMDPDCIVGATAYPSYVAAIYAGERPMWADIFGSLLAEAQAKAAVYWDNSFLEHFRRINWQLVHTADRFSTVSGRQKCELIGQLGFAARLCAETFAFDFVSPIPCGVESASFPAARSPFTGGDGGSFIVLWSGGFNTWTDVDTLFEGVELAMSRSDSIRFVSTGGEIKGHDEKTYERFRRLVEASPYRERFALKGWVKRTEAQSYYGAASVGLNIDASHYEVMFGSRNRILEWGLAGLPAVSTDLCELTGELAAEGLLFTFPAGDPSALSGRLLELERDRGLLAAAAARLNGFVLERYSFESTTGELAAWVDDPRHAPDFDIIRPLRLQALEGARLARIPPITPDSPLLKKLGYYLKNEGLRGTLRRSARLARGGRAGGRDG